MKAGWIWFCCLGFLTSCSEGPEQRMTPIDSMGRRLDSAAVRLGDSTRERVQEIYDRIDSRFERRDSAGKAGDNQ